jgi:tripartite-type tricarboxylate transporter receptor subunit TctC
VKSGKLRALAVSSGQRIAILPEVPTVAESGYAGFDAVDWKMLVAPAGTPRQVVVAFNAAVNRALAQAETLARLLSDGSRPIGGTPEDAVALLHAEHARWGALVREAGVKLD